MSAASSPAITASQDWTLRFGGPVGRRSGRSGIWFDPVPWSILVAVVSWVILMVRQVPCLQTQDGHPVNSFLRLCYSDIPLLYQNRTLWTGGAIFTDEASLEYPVLTGGFIAAARWLTDLLGGVVSPAATGQERLDAANIFFVVSAVLLFCCFLATVVAHLQMGRDSSSSLTDGVRVRAWDALLIAASPSVMAAGLINWDMFAVALTSLGLLLWARKKPALAGMVIGLAFAAKFYALILVPVYFLLCLRAGKMRQFLIWFGVGVVSWLAVNLPVMLTSFTGWTYFWRFNADRGADLGSLWYVLSLAGLAVPKVSAVNFAFTAAAGLGIVVLVLRAPRRPRVGQIGFLILVAFLVFNKVYSPQYVLWLLPFVVLARPKVFDVVVFTIGELFYFVAIWGFLEGIIGPGTVTVQIFGVEVVSGSDRLYWLAVLLRIGVQCWIAFRVVRDINHPWEDPVRLPHVDDPIGGILDHAPDAAWFINSFGTRSITRHQAPADASVD